MKVDVSIHSPKLRALSALLGGATLLRAMGVAVKEKTVDYLREIAGTRHDSANRVGGTYTGFYSDRTQAVERSPLTVGGEEASFVIKHPGIARAFHEVTILPKNSQYLVIPLNALAYGHSPREFERNVFIKAGHRQGKDPDKKLTHNGVGNQLPAWLLVPSVTQDQDRTLLPSDREWKQAAIDAATALIKKPA